MKVTMKVKGTYTFGNSNHYSQNPKNTTTLQNSI